MKVRYLAALWVIPFCHAAGAGVAAEPGSGDPSAATKVLSIPDPNGDSNLTDPGRTLTAPWALMLQVDAAAAAARIRQGSKEIRETARGAASDARQSLDDVANELEELSRRVEARGINTAEELNRPFARAFHALAQHHLQAGEQYWELRERRQAGHRLRNAADNLERLAATTGHRLSATANEAVRESRLVSGKLIEGAGYATDEVGKAFEALGKHVEAAGHNLEPIAAQNPATPAK